MLWRTYLKCVEDVYLVTLVSHVKIVGDYCKPVTTVVPANLLSLNLVDSGQLPSRHSKHLRLCSPACQQLPVWRKVDVVFFKPICSQSILLALENLEAVADKSIPQSHLYVLIHSCQ